MQAPDSITELIKEQIADFIPIEGSTIRLEIEAYGFTTKPTLACLDMAGEVFPLKEKIKTVRELYRIAYPTQVQLGHLVDKIFSILAFILV